MSGAHGDTLIIISYATRQRQTIPDSNNNKNNNENNTKLANDMLTIRADLKNRLEFKILEHKVPTEGKALLLKVLYND